MALPNLCACGAEVLGFDTLSGSCASSARSLYCVGGEVMVEPYPSFFTSDETARHDSQGQIPNGGTTLPASGTISAPNLFVWPGETRTPVVVTNTSCYPLRLMAEVTSISRGFIGTDDALAVCAILASTGDIEFSATTNPIMTFEEIHNDAPAAGPRRHWSTNLTFKRNVGDLPAGGSASFEGLTGYFWLAGTNASGDTTTWGYTSTVRLWGQTVVG